ncbi:MAG: helix-turn-helix domain-containing protein [Chloroflexi bacterium]|nr:MAG: helix-turn-helix domain-containing protein [Chloroflexota bacterium]
MRPRPLSVVEAAAVLHTSEAYVRRLLASRRLYGIKIGPVWGVFEEDLESFMRLRRPPGRPRKARRRPIAEKEMRLCITRERAAAGTDDSLLKPKGERTTRRAG